MIKKEVEKFMTFSSRTYAVIFKADGHVTWELYKKMTGKISIPP